MDVLTCILVTLVYGDNYQLPYYSFIVYNVYNPTHNCQAPAYGQAEAAGLACNLPRLFTIGKGISPAQVVHHWVYFISNYPIWSNFIAFLDVWDSLYPCLFSCLFSMWYIVIHPSLMHCCTMSMIDSGLPYPQAKLFSGWFFWCWVGNGEMSRDHRWSSITIVDNHPTSLFPHSPIPY